MKWFRRIAMDGIEKKNSREIWDYSDKNGNILSTFPVEVTLGKSLNVLKLKNTSLKETRSYVEFLRETVKNLYGVKENLYRIEHCPCCDTDSSKGIEAFTAFDIVYTQCQMCGHAFVAEQLLPQILKDVFARSEEHSSIYINPETVEPRLRDVVSPKLKWVQSVYEKEYPQKITKLVDVGAGGGHFVEVCRRNSISATGFEISASSRKFARDIFGLELLDQDFLQYQPGNEKYDVVAFWGLLEYIQKPQHFVSKVQSMLSPEGMLVIEVPRYDCLSTSAQREFPDQISRHLDPSSHVNCFSDSSLLTLLYKSGFKPVAAWYFGMDVYELLTQMALTADNPGMIEQFAHSIPGLQNLCDQHFMCDDIIIAAVPM